MRTFDYSTCPNGPLILLPLFLATTAIILSLVVVTDLFKTDGREYYTYLLTARVLSLSAFFLGLLITLYLWSTTCFFWGSRGFTLVTLFYFLAFFCQLLSFLFVTGYARDGGHRGSGKVNMAATVFWFVTAIVTCQLEDAAVVDSSSPRHNIGPATTSVSIKGGHAIEDSGERVTSGVVV